MRIKQWMMIIIILLISACKDDKSKNTKSDESPFVTVSTIDGTSGYVSVIVTGMDYVSLTTPSFTAGLFCLNATQAGALTCFYTDSSGLEILQQPVLVDGGATCISPPTSTTTTSIETLSSLTTVFGSSNISCTSNTAVSCFYVYTSGGITPVVNTTCP